MSVLGSINQPADLKRLRKAELYQLAQEIRDAIVDTVAKNGGHLAPNLGVVELTIALHSVLSCPKDKIVWDVGHQSYAHKLLTGRREVFSTLRLYGGISGYPTRRESEYDAFGVGHSSTSISAALGMALARDARGGDEVICAVIGDGALTGGMAFEGLNYAGHVGTNLLVVVNDNEMSIAQNVGALSRYLTHLRVDPTLSRARNDAEQLLKKVPAIGEHMYKIVDRLRDTVKTILVPGRLFQELGFTYFGPIDGHDISGMQMVFREAIHRKGPVLVHVITKKGKGWPPAEANPEKFHSIGCFDAAEELANYEKTLKASPHFLPSETSDSREKPVEKAHAEEPFPDEILGTYSDVFGAFMTEAARRDDKIVGITAAMPEGTGLYRFARVFPERFFDVGIAEEHAVTLAAGLAVGGMRPVFAVYSTFLQRAVDQVIHDVALQELPVLIALDRAGLVGPDGPTHHGVFDLTLLRGIPNLVVLAPKDGQELVEMLHWSLYANRPVVVRYPREKVPTPLTASQIRQQLAKKPGTTRLPRPEWIKHGADGVIVAVGSMVGRAVKAAELLEKDYGYRFGVVNLRIAAPLDIDFIKSELSGFDVLVSLEENIVTGGVGEGIVRVLAEAGLLPHHVMSLGIPDCFVPHGEREELLRQLNLSPEGIAKNVEAMLAGCSVIPAASSGGGMNT